MTQAKGAGEGSPLPAPGGQDLSALRGWIPYEQAAALIHQATGADPWPFIKSAIHQEALQARGTTDLVPLDHVRPVWMSFLADCSGTDAPDGGMLRRDDAKVRAEMDKDAASNRVRAEAPMPEWIKDLELRAPDLDWLAARLRGEADKPPPAELVFFDVAAGQVAERLGVSADLGAVRLIQALSLGRVTARMAIPGGSDEAPAGEWTGAAMRAGLLMFQGSSWHLRRFLVAATDLAQWLDHEAPRPAEKAPARQATMRRRKGRINWEPALAKVSAALFANGCPEPGDGGQARLEKLAAEAFPPNQCPSESTIRSKVSRSIAEHRAALNGGR